MFNKITLKNIQLQGSAIDLGRHDLCAFQALMGSFLLLLLFIIIVVIALQTLLVSLSAWSLGSTILAWLACLHRCCPFILFLLELLTTLFDFKRTQLGKLAVPIVDSIQQASEAR